MPPSESGYPLDYHQRMCELCQQIKMVRWEKERQRWVCDECDAHFYCIECGQKVLPENVAEEVEFGLYLVVNCKKCAKIKNPSK